MAILGRRRAREALREGLTAYAAGDFPAAERAARAALQEAPEDPDALVLAGRVACSGINPGAALDYFERAVLARPDYYLPYAELALIYARAGAHTTARRILELALDRVPESAVAASAFAAVFGEFELERTKKLYERALALDPEMREAEFGLVEVLLRLGELDAARRHATVASEQGAADRHSLNLRAMVADAFDDLAGAQAMLEGGTARHPTERSFLFNLYALHAKRGLDAPAERYLDRLLERFPEDANARLAKAAFLLRRGDFRSGFSALEARLRLPEFPVARHADLPRWDGGELQGKRILVVDEQGLGDSVLFLRFLPLLLSRGASVRYLCRAPLYSLYAGQAALVPVEIVTNESERPATLGCDCYVQLLSLPHLLQIADPAVPPYLVPPAGLTEEWAEKLPDDGRPRIGIVWSANLHAPMGPERSLPLERLQPLLSCPEFQFVSLQVGGSAALAGAPALFDAAAQIHDFADTAAITANLDLLVTVDTAAAHVAGALGVPALVMVPLDMDWRWGGARPGESFWYATARVFRQKSRGDWRPVVEEVVAAAKKTPPEGGVCRTKEAL